VRRDRWRFARFVSPSFNVWYLPSWLRPIRIAILRLRAMRRVLRRTSPPVATGASLCHAVWLPPLLSPACVTCARSPLHLAFLPDAFLLTIQAPSSSWLNYGRGTSIAGTVDYLFHLVDGSRVSVVWTRCRTL